MKVRYLALCTVAALALCSSAANAGNLYQLDFRLECASPGLPMDIVVNVYEGDNNLKGTSSTTFDGDSLLSYTSDAVASIVGVGLDGGNVFIDMVASGYDNGKYKNETSIEVCINGTCSKLSKLHTSCSREIPIGRPLELSDEAVDEIFGDCSFTVTSGVGECLPGQPNCPGDLEGNGDKLYELDGFFTIDLGGCVPGNITLTLEGDKGTSTATWDGVGLTNIVCDNVACLTNAYLDGGNLIVEFESNGYKDKGEYSSGTKFNIDLGCGVEYEIDQHTSCSQAIILDVPVALDKGNGSVTWTGGCGACVVNSPVAVQHETWGTVKSRFKE